MKLNGDLEKLINLWDGTVSLKESKNGVQMTFTKKFKCLNEEKRDLILEKVLGSHGFMTIEGDQEGNLLFSVPVRSSTLTSFKQLCGELKTLENVDRLLSKIAN